MHTVRNDLFLQRFVSLLQVQRLETRECGAYPKVKEDAGLDSISLSHVKLYRVLGGLVNLSARTSSRDFVCNETGGLYERERTVQ